MLLRGTLGLPGKQMPRAERDTEDSRVCFWGAAAPKDHRLGHMFAHGLSPLLCPVKIQVLGFKAPSNPE